jgi:hypothetical protein
MTEMPLPGEFTWPTSDIVSARHVPPLPARGVHLPRPARAASLSRSGARHLSREPDFV